MVQKIKKASKKPATAKEPPEEKKKSRMKKAAEEKKESPQAEAVLEHPVEDEKPTEKKPRKPDRYFEAVGRRKTSVARVRLFTRAGDFTVNDKPHTIYFPTEELQRVAEDSLKKMAVTVPTGIATRRAIKVVPMVPKTSGRMP